MKFIVSFATAGLLVSTAAFAQTSPAPAIPPATGPQPASITSGSADPQQQAMFTTVSPSDQLSSVVIGLDVYNNANQNIGTIKDIAYTGTDVKAYIVSVGGLLGVGDHYVAVSPSDLKVAYDPTARKWHANMDSTVDQLKSAPACDYPPKA
jgi:hypothetical protein